MKVLLAKPRGFCAGVDRAVDIVEVALQVYGKPVYMRHHIVHNPTVVRALEAKGAIFVEHTKDIPEGGVAVLSAHGVAPDVRQRALERKLITIDATCPLVQKVHYEAKAFAARGYTIVLIGHRGHVEMEGTMGEAPGAVMLIETSAEAEVLELPNPDKTIVLTQTTLSVDDTKETIAVLKRRFPAIQFPPREDICYATTNRQMAVRDLAPRVQVFLMIGAPESSNTMRLVETARGFAIPAHCIERAVDIQPAWLDGAETIGVTAGASAPEHLVQEVLTWLRERGAETVEEVVSVVEHMKFPLPAELVAAAKSKGAAMALLAKHSIGG